MDLEIRFSLDSDAFYDDTGYEVARILADLAKRFDVAGGIPSEILDGDAIVRDVNGNTIGSVLMSGYRGAPDYEDAKTLGWLRAKSMGFSELFEHVAEDLAETYQTNAERYAEDIRMYGTDPDEAADAAERERDYRKENEE